MSGAPHRAKLRSVSEEPAERNARVAADLGLRTFIMDDGWFTEGTEFGYHRTGDWRPVSSKFPDFRAHVRHVQDMGLKCLLWVAPFMVGRDSQLD